MGTGMGEPSGPLSATRGCTHTPWAGMGYQWVWIWVWEKIPMPITSSTCGTQGTSADHPCPHCLVHKDQLHEVINSSPIHTVKTMHNAYSNPWLPSPKLLLKQS